MWKPLDSEGFSVRMYLLDGRTINHAKKPQGDCMLYLRRRLYDVHLVKSGKSFCNHSLQIRIDSQGDYSQRMWDLQPPIFHSLLIIANHKAALKQPLIRHVHFSWVNSQTGKLSFLSKRSENPMLKKLLNLLRTKEKQQSRSGNYT